MRRFVVAAALVAPIGIQGHAVAQPVYCDVTVSSADGSKVYVGSGLDILNQITWLLPQTDPLSVSLSYLSASPSKLGEPVEARAQIRLDRKEPGTHLAAVFSTKRRSWRIEMKAFEHGYGENQQIVAEAQFDPKTSDSRDVADVMASSEPLSLAVEEDGKTIASETFAADRRRIRDALVSLAFAKITAQDPTSCRIGAPPLLVPPPPARPLP
jgi:hypothetical protein